MHIEMGHLGEGERGGRMVMVCCTGKEDEMGRGLKVQNGLNGGSGGYVIVVLQER